MSSESRAASGGEERRRWGWIRRSVVLLLVIYTVILVALLVLETTLVYPGASFALDDRWEQPQIQREEIAFVAEDGTRLVGWFLEGESDHSPFLVCHGNGEDACKAAHRLGDALRREFHADVLVFDYRGYGKSGGTPRESGVLSDGVAALDWLNERTGTTPGETIVLGHSLGGAVAVHVAATRGARALILQRTFDSLVRISQERYWMFPVSWLMQNRYPSSERIARCPMPLFQSHGENDFVVPLEAGEALFAASPAKVKEFVRLEGGTHFSKYSPEYFDLLAAFLQSIE